MCNFNVNQKVVSLVTFEGIVKNDIYTIFKLINCKCGVLLVGLSEVDYVYPHIGTKCNCNAEYPFEYLYNAKRFRPLDHQFAEDLLAEITELAKQDELVNV